MSRGETTRGEAARGEAPQRNRVVFLLDVDNTLLDNERVNADLRLYLELEMGAEGQERYWAIFETQRATREYADYLGALQRYRVENPHDQRLFALSSFLLDYPFETRLFSPSLPLITRLSAWGPTVILTDGDVVFQPRKVERSGLLKAVEGRVLIYIHKELELDDIERRYPADHYVLVDDKIRILTAFKKVWDDRLTTVFVRQGRYALDPGVANYPPADITLERIGDLHSYDLVALIMASRRGKERK